MKSRVVTAIAGKALEAGLLVKEGAAEADVQLSTKSALTSNSSIGEMVARALQVRGVDIQRTNTAKDVGIGVASGSRRTTKVQVERLRKGSGRADGINSLAKQDARAHSLICTGLGPQQSYGLTVQGASPSMVDQLRKNFKKATQMGHTRSCLTSTLAWVVGIAKDPFVTTKVNQIKDWTDIWVNASPDDQQRIRRQC